MGGGVGFWDVHFDTTPPTPEMVLTCLNEITGLDIQMRVFDRPDEAPQYDYIANYWHSELKGSISYSRAKDKNELEIRHSGPIVSYLLNVFVITLHDLSGDIGVEIDLFPAWSFQPWSELGWWQKRQNLRRR